MFFAEKSFYDPGKDFQCLDGSATIPFMLVNDDYCDCDDGNLLCLLSLLSLLIDFIEFR